MKRLFVLAICYFGYFPAANACDFPLPEIKTSEFISDKTVFWGRATAKKWDRHTKMSVEDNFPTSTYLDVEVIRPLQGKISKDFKVWLSESSCGIDVTLGRVSLFVVRPIGKSDFYADQLTSSIASDRAVISFLKLGMDVQVGGVFYPPSLVTLKYERWQKWLEACESAEPNDRPHECLSLPVLKEISDAYDMEYEEVESLAFAKAKPWWSRFTK